MKTATLLQKPKYQSRFIQFVSDIARIPKIDNANADI